MNPTSPSAPTPEPPSTWPASSILFWGTFGGNTPAGRRYHNRCLTACGVALAGVIGIQGFASFAGIPEQAAFRITALLPGVAFAFIAWEFRRYINSLDELARRIQLEAATWTYLTGMVAAMFFWGYSAAARTPLPAHWPAFFLVLEPVRGFWLYFVSRKY